MTHNISSIFIFSLIFVIIFTGRDTIYCSIWAFHSSIFITFSLIWKNGKLVDRKETLSTIKKYHQNIIYVTFTAGKSKIGLYFKDDQGHQRSPKVINENFGSINYIVLPWLFLFCSLF